MDDLKFLEFFFDFFGSTKFIKSNWDIVKDESLNSFKRIFSFLKILLIFLCYFIVIVGIIYLSAKYLNF
jgi:hypothetical protein